MIKGTLVAVLALGPLGAPAHGQPDASAIRPELTDWRETSSWAEVRAHLARAAASSDDIHLAEFGTSHAGRELPLIVIGAPGPRPAQVYATGKLRVYIQGTIHGGEVSGKEALLQLVRGWSAEPPDWASELVLLVAPVYNVDANENVAHANRPLQNGPVGGMGSRRNAQDLDLNRDHIKLESPEARALVALLERYDPQLVVDLHTTNGTRHAYHLTYSPPLHPNTHPAIDSLLRDRWLPTLTERMAGDGWNVYHYGNVPRDPARERGWYTFSHTPRFGTNYVGLRNRLAILSEAYAYLDFKTRVQVTRRFVERILELAHSDVDAVRSAVEAADHSSVVGRRLATRAVFRRTPPAEILLGEVDELSHPVTGEPMLARREVQTAERVAQFIAFEPAASRPAPRAWLVPTQLEEVLETLRHHGVRLDEFRPSEPTIEVERFVISSAEETRESFEGRRLVLLQGDWLRTEIPSDTYWRVTASQPLGRLAFTLLEPESDDGLAAWRFFGDLRATTSYPIFRLPSSFIR